MIHHVEELEKRVKRIELILYVLVGISVSEHPGALAALSALIQALAASGAFAAIQH